MYIVFERDQCYPQYLITFLLDSENHHSTLSDDVSEWARKMQERAVKVVRIRKKIQPLLQRPPKPKKRPDIGARSSSSIDADSDCVIS